MRFACGSMVLPFSLVVLFRSASEKEQQEDKVPR
jgi:hypothetical protein